MLGAQLRGRASLVATVSEDAERRGHAVMQQRADVMQQRANDDAVRRARELRLPRRLQSVLELRGHTVGGTVAIPALDIGNDSLAVGVHL